MNILDAMMANLNCFDNYQIINLHKQTTEEVHKRLNNINVHNPNDKLKTEIDREFCNISPSDLTCSLPFAQGEVGCLYNQFSVPLYSNDYNDVDEYYDCNCEYDCQGECHKNKPRLSFDEQQLLKTQLDMELNEYMNSYPPHED